MIDARVAVSILKLFAGENSESEYRSNMLEIAALIEELEGRNKALIKVIQDELLISRDVARAVADEAYRSGKGRM